jgi:Zn-dependent protease
MVAIMGPLANLLLAYCLKLINIIFNTSILDRFILLNLIFAVYTLLPIPPINDGIRIFYWSRLSYAFIFAALVSAALLIYLSNNFLFILVGSLFIGGIVWFLYYILYEETAWGA